MKLPAMASPWLRRAGHKTARWAAAAFLSLLLALAPPAESSFAGPSHASDSALPHIIILPFKNLSGMAEVRTAIMTRVYAEVAALGWEPIASEAVESSLRRNRVRDTGQISAVDAQDLAAQNHTPWILLGSIDTYDAAGPLQVGFSARLLNVLTEEIVWANTRHASSFNDGSLSSLNAITSIERLADQEIRRLLGSLWRWTRSKTARIQPGQTVQPSQPRVFIIPFENVGSTAADYQIVEHILLARLIACGFSVVEPGMVKEQLLLQGVSAQGQVDCKTAIALGEHFAADYCLTGALSLSQFIEQTEIGSVPIANIEARLLDVATGKLIWGDSLERSGQDFVKIFQFGLIQSPGKLLEACVAKLLNSLKEKIPFPKV